MIKKKYMKKSQFIKLLEHITENLVNILNEEESFKRNSDWFLYEGNDYILVEFKDGSKLKLDVNFNTTNPKGSEDWRSKAGKVWKSEASKIYKENIHLNEAGNEVKLNWKECFKEALKSEKVKPFIKKHAPIFDPINFTQTG